MKDEPEVIARIEDSIQTGEPITVEDKIYHFEERKLVHKSSDKSKLYVMVDSAKQYQHLREVEQERQKADDANRAKTEFLARMSHEIRTPMNAVLGMDEMILRERTEDAIKEYAMDIQTADKNLEFNVSVSNDISFDLRQKVVEETPIDTGELTGVLLEYLPEEKITYIPHIIS